MPFFENITEEQHVTYPVRNNKLKNSKATKPGSSPCVITFFLFQNNPITKSDFTAELLSKDLIMKLGNFPIKIWP